MSGDKQDGKLPRFESIDDLAAFFDAHSTEELKWEAVDAVAARKSDDTGDELVHVSVRLPRRDVEELKRAARRAGLGYTSFIRMILRPAVARSG